MQHKTQKHDSLLQATLYNLSSYNMYILPTLTHLHCTLQITYLILQAIISASIYRGALRALFRARVWLWVGEWLNSNSTPIRPNTHINQHGNKSVYLYVLSIQTEINHSFITKNNIIRTQQIYTISYHYIWSTQLIISLAVRCATGKITMISLK